MHEFRYGEWVVKLDPATRPREVMVEVTTRCNYSCIHCFRNYLKEPNRDMGLNLFEKILGDSKRAGVVKVVFSGWGEPLVHPRIMEFIEMSKSVGMSVLLNTNGALLEHYAEEVAKLGVEELVVSVDSVETDLYQAVRVGGSLKEVVKGLLKLKEIRRARSLWRPVVSIHFTVTRLNYRDVPKLVSFAKEMGVTRVTISNVVPLSSEHENMNACYADPECVKYMERAREVLGKESLDSNVAIEFPSFSTMAERRCPFALRYALYVRVDGRVAPCIYYAHEWRSSVMGVERAIRPVALGDVARCDLAELWRSEAYARLRFRTTFFTMPSCLDCPLQKYCIYTLSNEVDCWGNTPTCAHCPYSHDMARCPL